MKDMHRATYGKGCGAPRPFSGTSFSSTVVCLPNWELPHSLRSFSMEALLSRHDWVNLLAISDYSAPFTFPEVRGWGGGLKVPTK